MARVTLTPEPIRFRGRVDMEPMPPLPSEPNIRYQRDEKGNVILDEHGKPKTFHRTEKPLGRHEEEAKLKASREARRKQHEASRGIKALDPIPADYDDDARWP